MVLILNNEELESVLDMGSCVDALYQGLKALGLGYSVRQPRIDLLRADISPARVCMFFLDGGSCSGRFSPSGLNPTLFPGLLLMD